MNGGVWKRRLDALEERHLERRMRLVEGPVGPEVKTSDGTKLSFSSNDYLGLANHPVLSRTLAEAAGRWGAGSASSRLVSGNTRAHDRLERAFADYLGCEEAVLFPSGYQANVGALFALAERGDVIFSDELVHASLVDGCRLSGADVRIFRHRDVDHLGELLAAEGDAALKLVVSDAVFSMDGDRAPLVDIAELAAAHDALVYVDEAHALGVIGPEGRGLTADRGLERAVPVRVGTLGKAFGTAGAFVACGSDAAGLIRSRARSLLYTTASPAPLAETGLAALELVRCADDLRGRLKDNIERFRELAAARRLELLPSDTPIQPVMVGSAEAVMEVSERLWADGLFVQGMRPPTVPEGTSRLRVTLTAAHETAHLERLVDGIDRALRAAGEGR